MECSCGRYNNVLVPILLISLYSFLTREQQHCLAMICENFLGDQWRDKLTVKFSLSWISRTAWQAVSFWNNVNSVWHLKLLLSMVMPECCQKYFSWEAGPWSVCSKTCGEGVQTRKVECQQRYTQNYSIPTSASLCNLVARPKSSQTCEVKPCADWRTSNWTEVFHSYW